MSKFLEFEEFDEEESDNIEDIVYNLYGLKKGDYITDKFFNLSNLYKKELNNFSYKIEYFEKSADNYFIIKVTNLESNIKRIFNCEDVEKIQNYDTNNEESIEISGI